MDLLLASYDAGSGVGLRVYRNNNNAASWSSISTNLPESGDYLDISRGDFDSDGNPDIVSGGVYGTKGIKLYYGDGTGVWTEDAGGLPSTGERVGCDVGDFNSDGNPDLLFGTYNEKGLEVFKNIPASETPPEVLSTSPVLDAQNVPLNAEITITFNVQMNTVVTESAISVNPPTSWSTTWTGSDSALTLSPTQNLNAETGYTLSISNEAESAYGVNLVSSYELSFTTGSSIDTTSPSVVSTTPIDNAQGVGVQSTVSITFSEPMDSAVAEIAISISPSVTTTSSWSSDGTVLSLSVNLKPETTYTVTVSGNARDLAGNQMEASYPFSFTTGSEQAPSDNESDSDTAMIILIVMPIIVALIILVILLKGKKKSQK
jgi:hypothetical protein